MQLLAPSNPALSNVELIPATSDHAPILSNLLELYIHDFSEFLSLEIGDEGRFGYPRLSLYWSDPNRHPFLIHVDGKLAGFAFVRNSAPSPAETELWDMAEFFILRRYRNTGIGTHAAHAVWRRFPGPWQVRVMQENPGARIFWARAVESFLCKPLEPAIIEADGDIRAVFSFNSPLTP